MPKNLEITILEQHWLLTPCGLAIWQDQALAVVADLHLSKGASLAASSGQFLPPYDSEKTLSKLKQSLAEQTVKTILFLGDSFHDDLGERELTPKAKAILNNIVEKYETVWIRGNHDRQRKTMGNETLKEYQLAPFTFRHEPSNPNELDKSELELSGHLHPKASIQLRGRKIRRACFLQTEKQLILPAYGSLTGGLDISHEAFAEIIDPQSKVHIMTTSSVITKELK